MKKYQLTEKLSTEALSPLLRVGAVSTRFFFRQDDAMCYKLDAHIDYMLFNGINEMDLWLAECETKVSHFFCKAFGEVGERFQCGTWCQHYAPKNGKSGACKHFGYTYEQTDRCFTLKLSNALVSQNEC